MHSAQFERAVTGFTKGADFQVDQILNHGWRKFTTNYCREHYRAVTGDEFSNTNSPMILEEVVKRRPDLAKWIKLKNGK